MATGTEEESPAIDDQTRQIAFLEDAATHKGESIERVDTHGAILFLAGNTVYKLKRAVRFSFMDFSTCEKRRLACDAEVRLNRRTAPDLYLGTRPILERKGDLVFGEIGEKAADAIDWVVTMRRFDQAGLLDRQADEGRLKTETLTDLAAEIARFHDAEPAKGNEGVESIRTIIDGNLSDLDGFAAAETLKQLRNGCEALLTEWSPLIDRRVKAGCVRHCHGDLHLGNVCEIDSKPVLFDCIEFNEDFARIDTLYDLAFLLMDLDHRGHRDWANLVLNRYLDLRPVDAPGVALLPLFLSMRAQIRAKVSYFAAQAQSHSDRAQSLLEAAGVFLDDALRYTRIEPPRLIAVGGASGSGKSTLATALAPHIGAAPGAVHLRSDVIRKRLWGSDFLACLPPEAYSGAMSRKTYGEMERLAEDTLREGASVIVDATFTHKGSRKRIESISQTCGVAFTGLWLDAPQHKLEQRVTDRVGDPSDATASVVRQQLAANWGRIDWLRLDSGDGIEAILEKALQSLD